ncbi:hypothetical protein IC582_024436 [Cucumis melo]|uniref:MLP-like protein 328 n=2 Tax=Cucumis melo TaxID=3656 RepID=A0A1S3BPT2_CUCME|nr:MLP-like protein 328 [Cucumis melo]KAA0035388.1 MLP-like protein 328 [Cucumis melo var. makuwa]TYK08659.1 MLP-like protein 328 [Cucumis melo var. makuwa]
MSLVGKFVSELEINAPAEKYYEIFKDKVAHIPNISPTIFQNVEVHEGDWDTHGHGSIKVWNYTLDGKAEVFKEQVEFDDENFAVTLIGLEGDVFEHYKSFQGTYKVVPKGPEHSLAVLTLQFEKLKDDSPYPYKYLDLMHTITKDIEAHLK